MTARQEPHPDTQTLSYQLKALAGEAVIFTVFALAFLFIGYPLRFGGYLWS